MASLATSLVALFDILVSGSVTRSQQASISSVELLFGLYAILGSASLARIGVGHQRRYARLQSIKEQTARNERQSRSSYGLQRPGVGPTKASKLFARKRPRLRPIYDSVLVEVTGTGQQRWEPIRVKLRENNGQLHHRLLSLREQAGLPPQVSALRVLDVIAWMEGKKAGVRPVPEPEEEVP